jgi:TusA-related sulfurtransferase
MSEVTLLTNTIDQEKIKESLYNNASILVNAIKSNPSMGQGSIDIIHSGSSVFDKKKMSRFLKEGNGLVISTATTMEKIEGSNIKTYVKDFTNKFSASGNYKFSIAAAVSGSVTNDFDINVEQSVERKFSQVRNMARFATVTLPTVITREELRKLVSGSILAAIDDIKTLEDAQEFVSMIGVAYMEKAYLGGTLTMSSKSESSEYSSEVNLTSDIEAEMKVLGKGMNASNHFQMGRNAGFINKNLEVTIHAKGGDSAQ